MKGGNWWRRILYNYPYTMIIASSFILLITFQWFFVGFQENLNALTIEIMGSLFFLIIVNLVIEKKSRLNYPKTKEFVYGRLHSALVGIAEGLVRFLPIDDDVPSSFFADIVSLEGEAQTNVINALIGYADEKNKKLIQEKFAELSPEKADAWHQLIEAQKIGMKPYMKFSFLVQPNDMDLANVMHIYERLWDIQDLIRHGKTVRGYDKNYIAADVFFISKALIQIINSGLLSYWPAGSDLKSIEERVD